MQILNVTNLPIYLPGDKAPLPFGDPFEDATATAASPGVFQVPGYDNPVAGDSLAFTFLAGGSIPGGINPAQTYYVVNPTAGAGTFNVAATKGGTAINTTSTGASLVAHLLSGEVDGVTLPFKPHGHGAGGEQQRRYAGVAVHQRFECLEPQRIVGLFVSGSRGAELGAVGHAGIARGGTAVVGRSQQ